MEIYQVILRTILSLILLFFLAKMMGKKQVSQLNLFDYIIGITMGSIVADISLDIEKNLISGVVAIAIYGLSDVLISYITMHNISLRRFITGVPTILIENNKIITDGLKKSKIDVNDLLAEARTNGYFNLEEIDYAIMETNGRISFQLKDQNMPTTKKDMKIKSKNKGLTTNVIIDEQLLQNNLKSINKTKEWLDSQLKIKGYNNYKNILLATIDDNEKIIVYEKNIKSDKWNVLE